MEELRIMEELMHGGILELWNGELRNEGIEGRRTKEKSN